MNPDYTKGVEGAKAILRKAFDDADALLQDNGLRLGDVEIATMQLFSSMHNGCTGTIAHNIEISVHAVDIRETATFTGK